MPSLPNRPPRGASSFNRMIRRNPALFGVPFIALIVGGSFGLQNLTQLRYDVHDRKTNRAPRTLAPLLTRLPQVPTEDEKLLQSKQKRKFDIRDEYFRMQAKEDASDWEPKRIERPAGTPEWGVAPENPRQLPDDSFAERKPRRARRRKEDEPKPPEDAKQ
ncbi:hypothetical protein EXIGLDRAFT_607739 [Exidia glandulosa HHB12029]|uniref:Cytochrome c oxidase assembly protein COX16, mitochondrial n=1 Tax=Exidia glandulosa HHB12029 TaxID=1314781 RepID=A0A165LC19_EXIGL|nr:hypothetical protein EXIGLDRAFT_607739 [Exidia glandulosa HHB12029]